MDKKLRPELLVAVLIGLAVLLPLLLGALYVREKHVWAQDRLDELEPRYARLEGIQSNEAALDTAVKEAGERLAYYVYPASQSASQAGSDAQQKVRTLLGQAGMQIQSSKVLPAKEDDNFEQIPLAVRGEGDQVALRAALAALTKESPVIYIDGLNLLSTTRSVVQQRGNGPRVEVADPTPRLSAQFDLYVLRARQ